MGRKESNQTNKQTKHGTLQGFGNFVWTGVGKSSAMWLACHHHLGELHTKHADVESRNDLWRCSNVFTYGSWFAGIMLIDGPIVLSHICADSPDLLRGPPFAFPCVFGCLPFGWLCIFWTSKSQITLQFTCSRASLCNILWVHTRVIFYVRRIGLYLYKYRIYGTISIYILKGLAFVYQLT